MTFNMKRSRRQIGLLTGAAVDNILCNCTFHNILQSYQSLLLSVWLHVMCTVGTPGAVLGILIWVGQSKAKQILGRPTQVVYVGIMGMTRAVWVGQARVWVGHGLIARTASGGPNSQLTCTWIPVTLSRLLLAAAAAPSATQVDSLTTGFDLQAYQRRRFWGLCVCGRYASCISTGEWWVTTEANSNWQATTLINDATSPAMAKLTHFIHKQNIGEEFPNNRNVFRSIRTFFITKTYT